MLRRMSSSRLPISGGQMISFTRMRSFSLLASSRTGRTKSTTPASIALRGIEPCSGGRTRHYRVCHLLLSHGVDLLQTSCCGRPFIVARAAEGVLIKRLDPGVLRAGVYMVHIISHRVNGTPKRALAVCLLSL